MDIKDLLQLCVKENASDLHISPTSKPILRVDGELVLVEDWPVLDARTIHDYVYSLLTPKQQKIFEERLEFDFSLAFKEMANFRVNAFNSMHGIAASFRVIPQNVPTLEEIGVPDVIRDVLNLSSGLILLTGPAGSGKSTTMAGMVDYINKNMAHHIITLEDPIEYMHPNNKSLINQRQIYRDTLSFSAALRAALREDPDVILVGEMRDLETIRLALIAAETGHLVLATLHTSSAPQAINRIIDVFPAGEKNIIRNIVSQSLQAVIYQTLLKRRGGGRVAAFEIMLGTPAVRNLIRTDKISQIYTVMQTSMDKGMMMMENCIADLITKGIVEKDVVHRSGFRRELFVDPLHGEEEQENHNNSE